MVASRPPADGPPHLDALAIERPRGIRCPRPHQIVVLPGLRGQARATARALAGPMLNLGPGRRYTLEGRADCDLPAWASERPDDFWQALDAHERFGVPYRLYTLPIPRRLAADAAAELVDAWCAATLVERFPHRAVLHHRIDQRGIFRRTARVLVSERAEPAHETTPTTHFANHADGGAHRSFEGLCSGSAAERRWTLGKLCADFESLCLTFVDRPTFVPPARVHIPVPPPRTVTGFDLAGGTAVEFRALSVGLSLDSDPCVETKPGDLAPTDPSRPHLVGEATGSVFRPVRSVPPVPSSR